MIPRKVLFVCTGNICRSPTAEGVARRLAEQAGVGHLFEFDSAGTHGYHIGNPPDPRTVAAAARRGYDLAPLRARQLVTFDFARFDHILAMDRGHLQMLQRARPAESRAQVHLFLDYAPDSAEDEVPDPYYGGEQGFEHVLDLVEAAAGRLVKELAGMT